MTVPLSERGAEQLRMLRGQHILSVEQFTPALLQPFFAQANSFAALVESGQRIPGVPRDALFDGTDLYRGE